MATLRAVTAHVIAAVAFVAAAIGLYAVVATESRLWGPEVAHVPQDNRFWVVLLFGFPHLIGLIAAVPARHSLRYALIVLAGSSLSACLSVIVLTADELNRTERVMALVQTLMTQLLPMGFTISSAWTAWSMRRKERIKTEGQAS